MIITDDSLLPKDGIQGPPGQSIVGPAGKDGTDGKPGTDARPFNPRGTWANRNQYEVLDVVEFFGNSYVARERSKGKYPPSYPRAWQLLAAKGEDGKEGSTTVIRHGSPRLVAALAEMEQLKAQLQQGGSGSIPATADVPLSLGTVVYASGDERIDAAKADALETSIPVGLVTADVGADETANYISAGPITNPSWNLTPNQLYFLNADVAGGITATAPDTTGHYVVIIGVAISPTTLLVEIHRAYLVG